MDPKPIKVLDVIDRVAIFNGSLIATDLNAVKKALGMMFTVARSLSANLEHSIAVANFRSEGTVPDSHPIRVALNELDAALELCGEGHNVGGERRED